MKQLKLFAVMMIVILASCSKDEPANDLNGAKDASLKTTTYPFAANGQYTSKASIADCDGLLSAVSGGSGQSINLGNFTLNGKFCYGPCSDEDSPSISVSNPELTFITQTGDKISFTYAYECFIVDNGLENPNGKYPVLTYQGTYWITGGTGKYHDTSGSGTLNINIYLGANGSPLGLSKFSMNGSIRFPYDFNTAEGPETYEN